MTSISPARSAISPGRTVSGPSARKTRSLRPGGSSTAPERSAEKSPRCSGSADTGSSIQKGIISSSTRGSGRWCPCRFTRSRQTPIWGSMSPSRRKAIFFWGRRPRTKKIPKTTGQSRRTSTFSMRRRCGSGLILQKGITSGPTAAFSRNGWMKTERSRISGSRSVTRRHRTQST